MTGPRLGDPFLNDRREFVPKKAVTETPTTRNDLSGFGDNVVKLTDPHTSEVLAYIGRLEGEEKVHFSKPVSFDQLEAVFELMQKKKFTKHISKERFDKAQEFADRKFS